MDTSLAAGVHHDGKRVSVNHFKRLMCGVLKAQKQSAISRLVTKKFNLKEILTVVDKFQREIEAQKIAAKQREGRNHRVE